MSHPDREQWMAFLYEDLEATEKTRLTAHLKSCEACQSQIQTWRATMSALNEYKAPYLLSLSPREKVGVRARRPIVRWAAAAAIFLAAGVAIGAASRDRAITNLRDRVAKAETESSQTKKALIEFAKATEESRAHDQQILLATVRELQSYRRDLETVATLTQESLKSAQSQLVRLASYTDPRSE